MNEVSNWNGYPIHGDVAELEAIISTPGLIALDKNDIVSVLEAEGESFVASGMGATLEAALNAALANLHIGKETITDLAIALWSSSTSVPMAAFGAISEFTSKLNSDVNIVWGFFPDSALSDTFKATLICSARPKQ